MKRSELRRIIKEVLTEEKYSPQDGDKPMNLTTIDDYDFWSDIFKNYNGFRPRDLSDDQLLKWINTNFVKRGNELIKT